MKFCRTTMESVSGENTILRSLMQPSFHWSTVHSIQQMQVKQKVDGKMNRERCDTCTQANMTQPGKECNHLIFRNIDKTRGNYTK